MLRHGNEHDVQRFMDPAGFIPVQEIARHGILGYPRLTEFDIVDVLYADNDSKIRFEMKTQEVNGDTAFWARAIQGHSMGVADRLDEDAAFEQI